MKRAARAKPSLGLSPPTSVIAATAPNQAVTLSWTPVSGATSYAIERTTTVGGAATWTATVSSTSYVDTVPATPQPVTYIYYVRTIDSGGSVSDRGAFDHATAATPLYDRVIAPGVPVLTADVSDLRRAVDAFRNAWNTSSVFANQAAPSGAIAASYLTVLVTALNDVRSANGWPPFTYSPGIPAPAPNGAIRAAHISELVEALR